MRDDLTKTEFEWLEQLARGGAMMIPKVVADRLRELGYAIQLLGGPGISPKGHERLRQGWR